jgi:hypothetical protein
MDIKQIIEEHNHTDVAFCDKCGYYFDPLLKECPTCKLTKQGGKYYREVDQSKSKLLIVDRNDMLSAITGVEPCPPPQTLNREKVMDIFDNMRSGLSLRSREEVIKWREEITDAICSLSLPTLEEIKLKDPDYWEYLYNKFDPTTLSEEEIEKEADLISAKNIHKKQGFRMGVNWAIKELTKDK